MAADGPLTMVVEGDPGVRVEGTCRIRSAAGEVEEKIAAVAPFARRWTGTAARCELTAVGYVSVELRSGYSRARTSTSGGTLVVRVG